MVSLQRLLLFREALICLSYSGELVVPRGNAPRSLAYLRAAEFKLACYYQAGVPFMYTTFQDEPDIEDVIVDRIAAATLDL